MREMWQHRGIRLIFTANLVSMIGSGMNSAAVIWYILQATHSEVSLGALIALQTLPSLLLLPFTGVIIDREDRRHLMMWLDAARGAIIFSVALLVLSHRAHLWQIYLMNILVAIGFWMFFPTVNALIQELTPDDKMLDSNSILLAALQGGWLMAGAVVGFVYNRIGLGGVLLIDCASYLVSIGCVFLVRKGRVTVSRPPLAAAEQATVLGPVARYLHELREGYRYVGENRRVLLIGIAWALFVAAMMTQGVLSAPLSERILHGGAVGYGWLNAGWAVGAFISVFYAANFIRRNGVNRSVMLTMGMIAVSLFVLPVSRWLALAVTIYFVMGSCRGHRRHRPLQRDDGTGAAPLHGTSAEHVFVPRQRVTNLHRLAGGRGCSSRRPDLRLLDRRSDVCGSGSGRVAACPPGRSGSVPPKRHRGRLNAQEFPSPGSCASEEAAITGG